MMFPFREDSDLLLCKVNIHCQFWGLSDIRTVWAQKIYFYLNRQSWCVCSGSRCIWVVELGKRWRGNSDPELKGVLIIIILNHDNTISSNFFALSCQWDLLSNADKLRFLIFKSIHSFIYWKQIFLKLKKPWKTLPFLRLKTMWAPTALPACVMKPPCLSRWAGAFCVICSWK